MLRKNWIPKVKNMPKMKPKTKVKNTLEETWHKISDSQLEETWHKESFLMTIQTKLIRAYIEMSNREIAEIENPTATT